MYIAVHCMHRAVHCMQEWYLIVYFKNVGDQRKNVGDQPQRQHQCAMAMANVWTWTGVESLALLVSMIVDFNKGRFTMAFRFDFVTCQARPVLGEPISE